MGKVKELYMDIQEKTWEVLEAHPTETFGNLVAQVASLTNQDAEFITPIVEEVWEEYKNFGFDGLLSTDEAQYLNEMESNYEGK